MSLDVYNLADKKRANCLVKLSDADLKEIEAGVERLKEKTGIYIDPYGTTRLHPNHGLILLNAITQSKKLSSNILILIEAINDVIKNDDVLIFEGD